MKDYTKLQKEYDDLPDTEKISKRNPGECWCKKKILPQMFGHIITTNQILCGGCAKWSHTQCENMTPEYAACISPDKFRCRECVLKINENENIENLDYSDLELNEDDSTNEFKKYESLTVTKWIAIIGAWNDAFQDDYESAHDDDFEKYISNIYVQNVIQCDKLKVYPTDRRTFLSPKSVLLKWKDEQTSQMVMKKLKKRIEAVRDNEEQIPPNPIYLSDKMFQCKRTTKFVCSPCMDEDVNNLILNQGKDLIETLKVSSPTTVVGMDCLWIPLCDDNAKGIDITNKVVTKILYEDLVLKFCKGQLPKETFWHRFSPHVIVSFNTTNDAIEFTKSFKKGRREHLRNHSWDSKWKEFTINFLPTDYVLKIVKNPDYVYYNNFQSQYICSWPQRTIGIWDEANYDEDKIKQQYKSKIEKSLHIVPNKLVLVPEEYCITLQFNDLCQGLRVYNFLNNDLKRNEVEYIFDNIFDNI